MKKILATLLISLLILVVSVPYAEAVTRSSRSGGFHSSSSYSSKPKASSSSGTFKSSSSYSGTPKSKPTISSEAPAPVLKVPTPETTKPKVTTPAPTRANESSSNSIFVAPIIINDGHDTTPTNSTPSTNNGISNKSVNNNDTSALAGVIIFFLIGGIVIFLTICFWDEICDFFANVYDYIRGRFKR
jgi:thiol:disulfide interchange protein